MTAYSATDAALEGFRLTRERPRVLLVWALFLLAANALGIAVMMLAPKEAQEALATISGQETPDGQQLMSALGAVAPLLLLGLVIQRTMDAAVYRLMLRPQEKAFFFLRLGADELRLAALRLIFVMMAILFLAVVQFGIVILGITVSAFGEPARIFVTSVTEAASWIAFLVIAVRLSLASVLTFDRKKISIFESWALTRGHAMRLLGAQVLALCCAAVLGILVFVVFSSVAGAVLLSTGRSMADLKAVMSPENVDVRSYMNPFILAWTLVGSLFSAVYAAAIPAPGGYIYRRIREGEDAAVAQAG
jgi:hypothetical protein